MGIDFGKKAQQTPVQTASQNVPPAEDDTVFEEYDIAADREQMSLQLVNSPEVDALASQIEVYNPETIVSFGSEAADEISKASDVVLNSMNMSQLDDSSEMLKALTKIMSNFDIDEIKEKPGLFGKLFGNLKKQLEKLLAKYKTMGDEVDKIYVQLKQYESEIKESNRKLAQMFDANVAYYHELVKYILAGEQGCRELEAYIANHTLMDRLITCAQALLDTGFTDPVRVLGTIDALKVRSSMTLFETGSSSSVFAQVLDRFYGGERDQLTLDIVAGWRQ